MSTTAFADPPAERPSRPRPRTAPLYVRLLRPLASLQLTVALFAVSTVLVFFGTVAMMQSGLWTVVDDYFRSAVVWIPFDLIRKFGTVFFDLPKDGKVWDGRFPFPGGWLIGGVMLANLLAAHLVRFKLTWKRSGVIALHAGVIALMVGEIVTGLYAVESTMTLRTGESTDFVDVTRETEIAVTGPAPAGGDAVVTVPQWMFEKPGVVRDDRLPFDLEVVEFWKNTDDQWKDKSGKPFFSRPDGSNVVASKPAGTDIFPSQITTVWHRLEKREESAGVDAEAKADTPSVVVRVLEKGTGRELARHFLSLAFYRNYELNRRLFAFPDQTAEAGGKMYSLLLRNKRVFKPYTVELLKFEHGLYPGTEIAKDFASTVRVVDRATGDSRDVRIWMNNPLRYGGDSFYQNAVLPGDSGTVLQVVRNPGRLLPYISCTLVALGMLVHFGIRLNSFVGKRAVA